MAHQEIATSGESLLVEQVGHVRTALGDLLVELDVNGLPADLRPGDELPDAAAFMRSLPKLEPPLSVTIAADREERI